MSFTVIASGRRLQTTGCIAWRKGETVGISFTRQTGEQSYRVSRFSRVLLEELG